MWSGRVCNGNMQSGRFREIFSMTRYFETSQVLITYSMPIFWAFCCGHFYLYMPIGKVWIFRLLFSLCVWFLLVTDFSDEAYKCAVMLFNACNAFNAPKPHQSSIHSLGSGSTPLWFRSWSCSCNLWYWWSGVLLRSCKVAYLLMVINAAVSAANSTPACPPRPSRYNWLLCCC